MAEETARAANEARIAPSWRPRSGRITADVRTMAAGVGPVLTPGVTLPMPVSGRRSGEFGMRYDPIYRTWQLHARS